MAAGRGLAGGGQLVESREVGGGGRRYVRVVGENVEGTGWEIVRPRPTVGWVGAEAVDGLVPDAQWLWESLQRYCVPECCGLDAFDLTHASVRWACGDHVDPPDGNSWRDVERGDPRELAAKLREAAAAARLISAAEVTTSLFGEMLTRDSFAALLEDLAVKLENPLPQQGG